VLIVKGVGKIIGPTQGNPKLMVLESPSKPILTMKGILAAPIIIKPVIQLTLIDTQKVPWNYKQTMMTYQGKKIIDEVNKVWGLTRSRRCFVPEGLRKSKKVMNDLSYLKKTVIEEESKEFLKRLKLPEYSIIDQLRKTPAQISLLSLMLHSNEHCNAAEGFE